MKMVEAFEGLNTPKALGHGYLESYEYHFSKQKVKTLLELGIHTGRSLVAWKKYFPDAQIVGIDNDGETSKYDRWSKFAYNQIGNDFKDISFEIGDAMDKDFLISVAEKYGGFDIVLDDCSHLGIQMQKSFEVLWDYTRFLYAIEDLHTQLSSGHTKGHYHFSHGDNNYTKDGNFVTGYLQNFVNEKILPENLANKTHFSNINDDTISHITIENFIAFIYKKE